MSRMEANREVLGRCVIYNWGALLAIRQEAWWWIRYADHSPDLPDLGRLAAYLELRAAQDELEEFPMGFYQI